MTKIFIDTSVFIRLLTGDDSQKFSQSVQLIQRIKEGKVLSYTSNVVVMEIIFVLTRQYSFSKLMVLKMINDLFKLRNLTLVEETNTRKALQLFGQHSIKYADCLIATQVPKDATLVTYDEDFGRIASLRVATPEMTV